MFAEYAIPVAPGVAAHTVDEFPAACSTFPSGSIVVKAQIHAGGRGKGTFADGFQGGVKIAKDALEAQSLAQAMLGNTLVTHQTGSAGRKVGTIYFTQAITIGKEYYLALLFDRAKASPVIIASTQGGIDIEEVAEHSPEKITRVTIDPLLGLRDYQKRYIAQSLGLNGARAKTFAQLLEDLYRLFWEKDASLVEINPLVTTPEGTLLALDAKITFDDNALYRHPDIQALRDLNEEEPKEIEASKADLNYIALDGNIACMVNGAGLAMATMDIIKHYGGQPANFLDVGGGANEEQVTTAFKIILSDSNVKGILVNIFGGIMKCDIIAKGIIAAAQKAHLNVPLVVRLEGTNVVKGKRLLSESGLLLTPVDSLNDAAEAIVSQSQA